jgi:hypothetical protein
MRGCEDDIKMDLRKIRSGNKGIHLTRDKVERRALVNHGNELSDFLKGNKFHG